jgi:hypothetical protein
VGQPRVARRVDVELGAERLLVGHVLRPLIDEAARVAIERPTAGVVFDEVLVQLGAHVLEKEPQVTDDRVVAQDAVVRLGVVPDAEQQQRHERDLEPPEQWRHEPERKERGRQDGDGPQHLRARRFDHDALPFASD